MRKLHISTDLEASETDPTLFMPKKMNINPPAPEQ
jgi:hypothetical protein